MNKHHTLKLLIVDDDPDDRDLFVEAATQVNHSCKCFTAGNGEEALMLLRSKDAFLPDFIFLDLNMPRMNGLQFFGEMKKNKNLEQIPVVIYSTSKQPEDIIQMERLGALAFITKPRTFDGICEAIADVVNAKQIVSR